MRLDTNPAHFVAEANYFNNDIVCNLHYTGVTAVVTNCHIPDDYAPEYLERYFSETIFEDWQTGDPYAPPGST